jgi:hypothetical protein
MNCKILADLVTLDLFVHYFRSTFKQTKGYVHAIYVAC